MVKTMEQTRKKLPKKTYLSDMLVGLVPKNINEKEEKTKRILNK
jgi:hypothetical protein